MIQKLMKGHTFKDRKHKVKYPLMAEIKLDEIRLDIRREHGEGILFRSYADKPLYNLHQFAESWLTAMADSDHMRLDTGVLVNRSFDDTYRYVRSSKGVPTELLGSRIEFLLFDDPYMSLPFSERMVYLDGVAKFLCSRGLPVIRPPRCEVQSEEEVFKLYGNARDEGYEGLMLKTYDHKYELGKRTAGWLKVKPEEDADGIITAINQAHSMEGTPLDRAGSVHVVFEDGSECDAGGIEHELGRLMLANQAMFIGQWCEVQYMERDRQGGYRHPRFHRLREGK
jgi:ATP-dependent DNA ligase